MSPFPAFVAWLVEAPVARRNPGVLLLLEAVAWFVVFTPLQIPNPFHAGSMNSLLQNEFLFVLLACAGVDGTALVGAFAGIRPKKA